MAVRRVARVDPAAYLWSVNGIGVGPWWLWRGADAVAHRADVLDRQLELVCGRDPAAELKAAAVRQRPGG